jgi:DNA transformation protein
MALDTGLVEWVREALAPIGTVTTRRMMGGATLYCDGTVFAILAFDELWFKADAESDAAWDSAGADRFTYDAKGRTMVMNYRRAPPDAYDDADALRDWARLAIEAGLRAPPRKRRKKG